jgi:hypothetical protein
MLILAFGYGNHSNRLFQNIHFEAYCKENDIGYCNPSFLDMHKYYFDPCILSKNIVSFLLKYKILLRIFRKFKLMAVTSFDSENIDITKTIPPTVYRTKNLYVGGWCFRVNDLTEKYQDYFIKKYTLKEKYYKNNSLLMKLYEIREKGQLIVGIHIRRGDYKYWEEGKFYFEDYIYQKYMQNIGTEIETNYSKKCYFIIFSSETTSIREDEYTIKSNNDWYVDHFLMSKCDFLIGPPSTFTMWASYIGKVPYFHITDDGGNISLKDFSYCKY